MKTRYETLTAIDDKLRSAIARIRLAKVYDSDYEAAEAAGATEDAENYMFEYGNKINELVEILRETQNMVNAYLDEDEFYNTDKL